MVGKKSGRTLLREEGLARTDNQMGLTSWPQITPINQKNYYTDYLKRDDQILAYRLQQDEARNRMTKKAKDRDRALALGNVPPTDADGDQEMGDEADIENDELEEQEAPGSKVIVIHPGSQNLRIGLSSDALPKTVPMVIAKKAPMNESEEGDAEPRPKRMKLDDGTWEEPEKQFGKEFSKTYTAMCNDLKARMRLNKRRVLPNSKEMVINYNRRTPYDSIPEHNDPLRIEWTELPSDPKAAPEWITGRDALRIPDNSKPRYKLYWPIRNGWVNERDYKSTQVIFHDILLIVTDAIKSQLGLNLRTRRDWAQYGCVFIIPDLYERAYVINLLDMALRDLGFGKVCFIQESLAASFGAGYTTTCIVDIGAQKTSVCCVEEGMCLENSRVNLKFGGHDVTETFIKMMLYDHFPYEEINLKRRYDFLLAEELKQKFCTMNEGEVSVQLLDFHLRASGQDTRKYTFKAYDETLLAPMGFFAPKVFEHDEKLVGRHQIMDRSYDLYDGQPNDPRSSAQADIFQLIAPHLVEAADANGNVDGQATGDVNGTPMKPQAHPQLSKLQEAEATPRSSVTGSPAPEGAEGEGTPFPRPSGTTPPPIPNAGFTAEPDAASAPLPIDLRDDVLPIFALDDAITTSVAYASKGDERKIRDFYGGIMVIGGGSQVSGFPAFLEERLHALRPMYAKDIMIGTPPRELDAQVVAWKGASVFGKLDNTNDSWIGQMEYDRLGSRLLAYKCMWAW